MTDEQGHKAPLVPISHATEDKGRFVLQFAERLRAAAIDAWLDQWEIGPGDSLVQKINTALDAADAFIVVLSPVSVTKPWVQAELNAATIARIERSCPLIPVVLEKAPVPALLRDVLQIRIDDTDHYDAQFDSLVRRLHGHSPVKPPIGSPPSWTVGTITIPGLNQPDGVVLDAVCRAAVAQGHILWSDPKSVLELCAEKGLGTEAVVEGLEELEHQMLVEFTAFDDSEGGLDFQELHPTKHGFWTWLNASWPDFEALLQRVIAVLANDPEDTTFDDLLPKVGNPPSAVLEAVLDRLADSDYLKVSKFMGGSLIFDISSRLRRLLQ